MYRLTPNPSHHSRPGLVLGRFAFTGCRKVAGLWCVAYVNSQPTVDPSNFTLAWSDVLAADRFMELLKAIQGYLLLRIRHLSTFF